MPSTALASPGYDGQPAVYLYIAVLEVNVLNCRGQGRAPRARQGLWPRYAGQPCTVNSASRGRGLTGKPVTKSNLSLCVPAQIPADRRGQRLVQRDRNGRAELGFCTSRECQGLRLQIRVGDRAGYRLGLLMLPDPASTSATCARGTPPACRAGPVERLLGRPFPGGGVQVADPGRSQFVVERGAASRPHRWRRAGCFPWKRRRQAGADLRIVLCWAGGSLDSPREVFRTAGLAAARRVRLWQRPAPG